MQHPEEGVIHAWLDGELSAEDAAALEAHVAECRECAATVAEARGLIAASSRIISALDIVPGDVIPAATPRKRAWYANTQLRAAAAVLVVAGASLIVMRKDSAPDMERLMSEAASTVTADSAVPQAPPASAGAAAAAAEPQSTQPTQQRAALRAPAKVAAPTPVASGVAADAAKERDMATSKGTRGDEEVRATEMSRKIVDNATLPKEPLAEALQGKVAGVTTAQPDTAQPLAKTRASAEKPQPARLRALSAPLGQVVITGAATTAAGPRDESSREVKLREVKSDTTANTVVTIYDVSPGVQVTLVELLPPGFAAQRRDERQKQSAATGNAAVLPAAPVASANVKIETITWTDASTGRTYTLSGPLSMEQLTALRKRLPPARR